MSGGVDSSFTAAFLQQRGWEVRGVHFLLPCLPEAREARVASVREAAGRMGIPVETVELAGPFTEKVIDPFVNGYRSGLTPNPCVVCNEAIKFEHLLMEADAQGVPYAASGHYARVRQRAGRFELLRGVDPTKEQSYFLQRLGQRQLSRVLLPLGDFRKTEVRRMSAELGLPEPQVGESREICFVPGDDYRSFLESRGESDRKGIIVEKGGGKLGEHSGTHRYTVGQRQGLGIASTRPYYVLRIDAGENRLVVGRKEDLYCSRVEAESASWVSGEVPDGSEWLLGQVRYRHRAAPGRLRLRAAGRITFEFEEPQWAVTPGQALAVYRGAQLLGGGWIRKEEREGSQGEY